MGVGYSTEGSDFRLDQQQPHTFTTLFVLFENANM